MRNALLIIATLLFGTIEAQQPSQHQAEFELGSGLEFSFNNGDYTFGMGGMMQPYIGRFSDSSEMVSHYINAKRVYFNIHGTAVNQKVSFLFRANFASTSPLLDAWISYQPIKNLTIYFGQKQMISNNRELLVLEDQLQFADRSILSGTFSQTGREFGIFIEPFIEIGGVRIEPKISITSGDGKNSFGMDSRDVDLGGFKYSARLDLYPFGAFSDGNENCIADLRGEPSPKLLLGAAASLNDGASAASGEGHGDFTFYNANSDFQRPDYRQLYYDLLFKFMGISILAEYNISTASGLSGAYLNESATVALVPTQISEFLSLGRAYNVQAGYTTPSGWGIDGRFSDVSAEFAQNRNSIVQDATAWQVGLSRYVKLNDLKATLSFGQMSYGNTTAMSMLEFMVQVRL